MRRHFMKTVMMLFAATTLCATQGIADEEDTMIVTATRTQTELENAPGAVTVIDRQMIEEAPARDLVDIIAETPGISLIGTGVGGRKTLSIRGADSRHTLILIDGRRIAASDAVIGHSNFENSWVPLEEIERIEVVRGPLSSLYGSEALGGVINIITKVPTDTWSGQVKLGGGVPEGDGGESINSGVAINGAVIPGRVAASVSAGYIHERAIPDEDNPAISEIEGREIYSFSPKIYLTPTKNHRIELFASIVNEERDYVSTSRNAKIDYTNELDKYTAGISWSGTTGPLESKIDLYRSQIDKVSIKETAATGVKSKTPDKATNDVVNAQTSMQLGFNLFTLGGEWREESIEADSLDDIGGEESVTYKSAFAQDEITLFNDRLLLTPGLRYDHHEYFGSEVSPRLYALVKVTDRINLKAGYGHAFNAPTAKQTSPGYNASSGPHSFIGNPDVKPETSDSYEVGVEYFGSTVTARAFYFYNEIDDLIGYDLVSYDPMTSRMTFTPDNVDKARIQGVETELELRLPHNLELVTSYNYLDAEDAENDIPLAGRPEHLVNVRLRHHLERFGLSSVLRYQYTGEQHYEDDDGNMERVTGYSLLAFSITKELTSFLSLQLGVENLGDVRLADKSEYIPYSERGRYVYATLKGTLSP